MTYQSLYQPISGENDKHDKIGTSKTTKATKPASAP
jgi:hypothetical protein